jgi:methylmalonyl-CoA mutase cobalamin-binding subunit
MEFAGLGDTGRYTPIRVFAGGIMAGVMPDEQELQDRRVAALLSDGTSFRQVAASLGLSLGAVQRSARRARELPASRVAVADPIVEL